MSRERRRKHQLEEESRSQRDPVLRNRFFPRLDGRAISGTFSRFLGRRRDDSQKEKHDQNEKRISLQLRRLTNIHHLRNITFNTGLFSFMCHTWTALRIHWRSYGQWSETILSETSTHERANQHCEFTKTLIEAEDSQDTKTHSKVNSCDKVGVLTVSNTMKMDGYVGHRPARKWSRFALSSWPNPLRNSTTWRTSSNSFWSRIRTRSWSCPLWKLGRSSRWRRWTTFYPSMSSNT